MIAYLLDIMKNTKKTLNGVVNTNFWGDKTCIVYKYCFCYENRKKNDKIKKKKKPEFINIELESDSSCDSEWL